MNNLRWILATEEEWVKCGLGVPNGRRITLNIPATPTSVECEREYILDHYERQSDSDEKYELLMANLPSTAFVSDRALQWILPVEEMEVNSVKKTRRTRPSNEC